MIYPIPVADRRFDGSAFAEEYEVPEDPALLVICESCQ